MSAQLYIVDAFAKARFSGNPAAVCLLRERLGPDWMQNDAMEMNLSETVFLRQRGGAVVVSVDGERVRLSGKAVTTMSGEFL